MRTSYHNNDTNDPRILAMSAWVEEDYEKVIQHYSMLDEPLSHMEQRRLNFAMSQTS